MPGFFTPKDTKVTGMGRNQKRTCAIFLPRRDDMASKDKMKKAKDLYKQKGMKLVDIAKKLDVPPGTVRRWKSTYDWDGERSDDKSERSVKKKNARKKEIPKEVKQVMSNTSLNDKQRLFCLYYSRSFNATRSYQKVYGVEYLVACANGPRLLGNDRVKDEINRLKEERYAKELLKPEDIFQKYLDIAFADITDYVEFGREEVTVMGEFGPIEIKNEDTGEKTTLTETVNTVRFKESDEIDGTIISEVKQGRNGASIKLHDRMKALQWLTEHMNMATEEQQARIAALRKQAEDKDNSDKSLTVTLEGEIEGWAE